MKTAVQLLQNYLESIQDPKTAAALFAADGLPPGHQSLNLTESVWREK